MYLFDLELTVPLVERFVASFLMMRRGVDGLRPVGFVEVANAFVNYHVARTHHHLKS